jgi:hypothetical protein
MTYNSFLDFYFSTYWISIGVPVSLIGLYYIFRKWIRKGKPHTFTERIVTTVIAFVMIMLPALVNPTYWGYGSPDGVEEIHFESGKFIVIDYIMTMGSRTDDGYPCSRVHIIDPKTGEKKMRFTVGDDARFVGIHGDTLTVTRYNDAVLFSAKDGHQIAVYSTETLPQYFPELSSGINSLMWGGSSTVMEMTAQNGSYWNLFLTSGMLYPSDANRALPDEPHTNHFFIENEEIRRDDENPYDAFISLEGEGENQHQLFITDRHDSILNKNLMFLDGVPVAVNEHDSCFVILHYQTLEKQKFILTCVSLDGKKVLWAVQQSQFNSKFSFSEYTVPQVGYNQEDNTLCFWIDKTVYCLDGTDGKLLWQTEL